MSFPEHDTPASAQEPMPFGHPSTWPTPLPAASQQPPSRPPARKKGLAAVVVVGVLALMAVTGLSVYLLTRPKADSNTPVPVASAATFSAAGVLILKVGEFTWNSTADPTCQGLNGYSDLRGGTQVVITDAAGKKIALGSLVAGNAGDFVTESDGKQRATSCSLNFLVTGVPRGAGPYSVEVSHRGTQTYTEAQLERGITLGFS